MSSETSNSTKQMLIKIDNIRNFESIQQALHSLSGFESCKLTVSKNQKSSTVSIRFDGTQISDETIINKLGQLSLKRYSYISSSSPVIEHYSQISNGDFYSPKAEVTKLSIDNKAVHFPNLLDLLTSIIK